MKKISILGMGYVGFPLACAVAKNETYDVYCFDVDSSKIKAITNKESPVEDLQSKKDIKEVKLTATTDFKLLENSDIFIIAVPTPVDKTKMPDLSYVKKASQTIANYLKKDAKQLVILESTVNPGVCEEKILPILEKDGLKATIDFDLIHSPERIDPGNEKYNVYNIARNVGGTSKEGTKKAADFYRSFINANINEMSSPKAVESTKIVENTFRDINIAYVNELAKSFDKLGIDIVEVIEGASNKPFAFMAHYPSCGVGGHCIPVDPYYLIEKAKNTGFDHKLLRNARAVNSSMPQYTVEKLILKLNELKLPVKGTKIGLLGLSYKANTSDIRESPALIMKEELEKLGADLMICEPHIKGYDSLNDVIETCEAIILTANHKQFLKITDWKNVKLIVDGKNCLDKQSIENQKILYTGIGR